MGNFCHCEAHEAKQVQRSNPNLSSLRESALADSWQSTNKKWIASASPRNDGSIQARTCKTKNLNL